MAAEFALHYHLAMCGRDLISLYCVMVSGTQADRGRAALQRDSGSPRARTGDKQIFINVQMIIFIKIVLSSISQ